MKTKSDYIGDVIAGGWLIFCGSCLVITGIWLMHSLMVAWKTEHKGFIKINSLSEDCFKSCNYDFDLEYKDEMPKIDMTYQLYDQANIYKALKNEPKTKLIPVKWVKNGWVSRQPFFTEINGKRNIGENEFWAFIIGGSIFILIGLTIVTNSSYIYFYNPITTNL